MRPADGGDLKALALLRGAHVTADVWHDESFVSALSHKLVWRTGSTVSESIRNMWRLANRVPRLLWPRKSSRC